MPADSATPGDPTLYQEWTAADCCVTFHRGLRKAVDSPTGSSLYAVVDLLCSVDQGTTPEDSVWLAWGQILLECLQQHGTVEPVLGESGLQQLRERYYEPLDPDAVRKIRKYFALYTGLRALSSVDRTSLVYFFQNPF